MATYTTYDEVGLKEDISDVISNLSPTKTPFTTLIGTESVHNTLYQWQEDSLADAAANAAIEGADASDATLTATTMRDNVTQIFTKTIKVSATSDAVKAYGRAKETAYQLGKKGAELKRDIEYAMISVTTAKTVGTSSAARYTASVWSMIDSSVKDSNSGTARDLSETLLLSVANKCYTAGAEPGIFMIKPADAQIVADFASSTGRLRDFGGGMKIVNVVNLYVSPYGEFKVVLNRFMKTGEALLFDPDMWKKCVLRPVTRELLAKTGDADKHFMVTELGLKHKNYKASGWITDLN